MPKIHIFARLTGFNEAIHLGITNFKNFLGNKRAQNYPEIIQELFVSYKALGYNITIKLHFLHSNVDGSLPGAMVSEIDYS